MTTTFWVPENIAEEYLKKFKNKSDAAKIAIDFLQNIGEKGIKEAIESKKITGGIKKRPEKYQTFSLGNITYISILKAICKQHSLYSFQITQNEIMNFAILEILTLDKKNKDDDYENHLESNVQNEKSDSEEKVDKSALMRLCIDAIILAKDYVSSAHIHAQIKVHIERKLFSKDSKQYSQETLLGSSHAIERLKTDVLNFFRNPDFSSCDDICLCVIQSAIHCYSEKQIQSEKNQDVAIEFRSLINDLLNSINFELSEIESK